VLPGGTGCRGKPRVAAGGESRLARKPRAPSRQQAGFARKRLQGEAAFS